MTPRVQRRSGGPGRIGALYLRGATLGVSTAAGGERAYSVLAHVVPPGTPEGTPEGTPARRGWSAADYATHGNSLREVLAHDGTPLTGPH